MHLQLLTVIAAAAGISARFLVDLPSATPTVSLVEKRQIATSEAPTSTLSPDPWQCVTENITQYFDVPKPTGSLLDSINSYGEEVVKPCKATATGFDYFSCTVSDPKSWCGFETAAPFNVLSDYSSYVTAAASFWTEKSSTISILSTSCAVAWARQGQAQKEWLKIATAHAQCYLDSLPTTTATTSAPSSTTLTASYADYLTFTTIDLREYADMPATLGLAPDDGRAPVRLAVQNPATGDAYPYPAGAGPLTPAAIEQFLVAIIEGRVSPWRPSSRPHDEL